MRNNYGPRWFTHWTAGISWFLTLLALAASWYVFQRLPDMIPAHGQGSLLIPKGSGWFLWPWFMAVGGVLAVLPYLVRDAVKWMISVWTMGFVVVCLDLVLLPIHVATLWHFMSYTAGGR